MQRLVIGVLTGLVGWLAACSHYSTQAGLVGGIKSVAVPVAGNQTSEAGIAEQLSARLADVLSEDGRLRVADEERADALLLLDIVGVEDEPFTYTAAEQTQQYRFRLRVDTRLERVEDGKPLLERRRVVGWGVYDASGADADAREEAVVAALDMVIAEVLDRTTASW